MREDPQPGIPCIRDRPGGLASSHNEEVENGILVMCQLAGRLQMIARNSFGSFCRMPKEFVGWN
jgi:hypothetical protein